MKNTLKFKHTAGAGPQAALSFQAPLLHSWQAMLMAQDLASEHLYGGAHIFDKINLEDVEFEQLAAQMPA